MEKIILIIGFMYCAHWASSTIGIYVLDLIDISGITFDLKKDTLKLAFCSLLELVLPVFIFIAMPQGLFIAVFVYLIVFWIITKIAYLNIVGQELLILGVINILGLVTSIWLASVIVRVL